MAAQTAQAWLVGAVLGLAPEPIRNPVSGAEVHPGAKLPEAIVFEEGEPASAAFRVSDGIDIQHPGRYAAVAPFSYAGR